MAPTKAATNTPILLRIGDSSPSFIQILRAIIVMLQNKKVMVSPLQIADMALTIMATLVTSPAANRVKKRAINWNKGAPGG